MKEIDLIERQLDSKLIFDGRILHVYDDTVSLPNGHTASRELIRHVGAVCVLPLTDDGNVIVERQYRYPVGRVLTEIPAGKLDSKEEDHEYAARRELREETGCIADEPVDLGVFYPAPAYSDEAIRMFLARGLHMGAQDLDPDEFLNVEAHDLDELLEMIYSGTIEDGKTIAGLLAFARKYC